MTYDMRLVYSEVTWVTSFRKPFDPHPDVKELCGLDGRPANVNPLTQKLGEGIENMSGVFTFPLTTLYLANAKVRVTVELSERQGKCKPVPEETQEPQPV
ncbi:MAG: hypothetical protein WB783_00965 [Arenicellales bacterium]